jgi:outer membrane protein OmpA-like peptidoglycan-associated protein
MVMRSGRHAIHLSAIALIVPLAVLPAYGADPSAPAWTADQLIEALDVAPDPEVTFGSRGIKPRADKPAAEAGKPTVEAGSGVVQDLKVFFKFNSADLTPDASRALDELGAALRSERLRDDRFRIAGHTDAVGDENYNLELSLRRAEAVVKYLESAHGVARTRLASQGLGESQLFDPADPASGDNRRVEVVNLRREGG